MYDLTISPQGHPIVREVADDDATPSARRDVPKALVAAFARGASHGLLALATAASRAALPPAFELARGFARLYLGELGRRAFGPAAGPVVGPVPPPEAAELEAVIDRAPPIRGLEYLTPDVLAAWWRDLDALVRSEAEAQSGGVQEFLRRDDPRWQSVGRVTFHLAENKRDADYPFAFLATFANGLTPEGKVRHEPLGRALQEYAGARNRPAMLELLLPVSKAAESVPWVKDLVESGEVYQPLALTPKRAYAFLRSIPRLEASGLVVRVPDWWNAKKPARPVVSVKVEARIQGGLTSAAMLDFSAELSLDGESLTADEAAELLASTGGLVPLRGKWVEVDPERLKQALEHWKAVERQVRDEGLSFFQGVRLLSGVGEAETDAADAAEELAREWSGLAAGPRLRAVLDRLRASDTVQEEAPRGCGPSSGPTSAPGTGGSGSRPAWAWAPAWPTTWAWARRSRSSPSCST